MTKQERRLERIEAAIPKTTITLSPSLVKWINDIIGVPTTEEEMKHGREEDPNKPFSPKLQALLDEITGPTEEEMKGGSSHTDASLKKLQEPFRQPEGLKEPASTLQHPSFSREDAEIITKPSCMQWSDTYRKPGN